MFKPTKVLFGALRLRLTTKRGNKNFYKGTGSGAMGRHTPRGGYILDMKKVRTYVVPEGLSTTNLKPYVTNMLPYETTRFDTPESGHHGYSKVLDRMIRENVDFGIEPPSKP